MKYRKIFLAGSLLTLLVVCNPIYGQSKSKEALGNSLVASIVNNDLESYKSLLLPKEVVLKYQDNYDLDNSDSETRDSLLSAYEHMVIPRYEKNFRELVALHQANNLNWNNLNFIILYKGESKGEEFIPFFMHAKLNNSDLKHFYFGAVRYRGEWYVSENMEIIKEEKYSSR